MPTVFLTKYPSYPDRVAKDGLCSYIKQYGIMIQRLKWAVRDETSLPKQPVRRSLSQILDPLAFQARHVEDVKQVEHALDNLFSDDWDGEPFTVATYIHESGSHGFLGIFGGSKANLTTTLTLGDNAATVDGPTVTFPTDDERRLQDEITLTELNEKFDTIYAGPKDGDRLKLRFEPADDGAFQLTVGLERARP